MYIININKNYNNIAVEFATYTLHAKNGRVNTMSGEFYNVDNVNTTPVLTKDQGFQEAKDLYGAGGAEEIAETSAWHAVGVGAAFSGGGGISYCSSNGNNTNDEYISRVQLWSINKTSGVGTTSTGYSDFTSTSTDLSVGASFSITITPTWTGTLYNEGYAVFIDYNQDGNFTDSRERVWTKTASQTTLVSGSFTVPSSATYGETTMRVSMKYNGVPTSCEAFSYGEVEDYNCKQNYRWGWMKPNRMYFGNNIIPIQSRVLKYIRIVDTS